MAVLWDYPYHHIKCIHIHDDLAVSVSNLEDGGRGEPGLEILEMGNHGLVLSNFQCAGGA